MVRNARRRVAAIRPRQRWLEANGQRRLKRLYARQQLRRQLMHRWSELSRPGLGRSLRSAVRGQSFGYDAGHGDLSESPTKPADAPSPTEVGVSAESGQDLDGHLRELNNPRPVPIRARSSSTAQDGYDAAGWDIIGD
jgi:hypothetical protein